MRIVIELPKEWTPSDVSEARAVAEEIWAIDTVGGYEGVDLRYPDGHYHTVVGDLREVAHAYR